VQPRAQEMGRRGIRKKMGRTEPFEVDPAKYDSSRRRFLRNAGMAAASVPFLGAFADVLTERGASAQTHGDESFPMFASHPSYNFTFINHVTTNTFFTATKYGIADACNLLGIPTAVWTGSTDSVVSDMVTDMNQAIAAKTKGIAVALIDPEAFNTPTDNALDQGIPVISYNADEPTNDRMAYIGQSNQSAGQAAAERIVKVVPKGGLVGMVIATPGTGNIQPRIDGAAPVFKAAGLDAVVIAGGALQAAELTAVQSWWEGHKDVKFLYSVDSGDSIAVATLIAKNNLQGKVGGSGWDVGIPVLQEVQKGALTFTIDQQAYLQGFVPVIQLFLYNISAGLMQPCDTNTGLGFVTSANVAPYLTHPTRWEGSGSGETAYAPPSKIGH
jgi:simple sugar transport system substrate-binding protein